MGNLEAILPLLVTMAIVIASIGWQILPNASDMVEVKNILCGGNLDFTIAKTPTGFMLAGQTQQFDRWHIAEPDLAVRATMELTRFKFGSQRPPNYSALATSSSQFDTEMQKGLKELS